MNAYGWFAGAILAVLALWAADHYRQSADAAQQQVESLKGDVDTLAANAATLTQALADRTALQEQLAEVGKATRQMNSTLATQSAQINRNFDELKRNDKAIADYLRQPVPVDLGVRYARPETTDPVAYRAGSTGLPEPGAVSPAGPTSAEAQ
ncbi:hypothetical protein GZ982_30285 (plasmid) [Pseudomonas fluorescens]|nr:hypothetical protein GZ982_30285 [Pseudomonas fluorescens]